MEVFRKPIHILNQRPMAPRMRAFIDFAVDRLAPVLRMHGGLG